jgi:hypothetical protein
MCNSPARAEQPFGIPRLGLLVPQNTRPALFFLHLFRFFCLFLQNEPNSHFPTTHSCQNRYEFFCWVRLVETLFCIKSQLRRLSEGAEPDETPSRQTQRRRRPVRASRAGASECNIWKLSFSVGHREPRRFGTRRATSPYSGSQTFHPHACLYIFAHTPNLLTFRETPLLYFGRFGRFGSFSYCDGFL